MKIEKLDNELIVFINLGFLKDYLFDDEKKSLELLPKLLLKIKKLYKINFSGLYKIKAYQNKKIGIIMEIIKFDDLTISDYTDFRIRIYEDFDFLLEFDDYFDFLEKYDVLMSTDKYYIKLNSIPSVEALYLSDYYNLIYKDIDNIIDNTTPIS